MVIAYISGALTQTRDIHACLQLYEELGKLCEEYKIEAFVPHIKLGSGDFFRGRCNAPRSPSKIFLQESRAIQKSDIILVCLDDPSTGVGAELQLAIDNDLDIMAFHHRDIKISNYIRGMLEQYSKSKILAYENKDALFESLKPWLTHHSQK
ncbi:hypothetical protein LCGC14_2533080 [marine sediment metagenome]|uniref:Nucleoside 2-deoxyribosyltransferase n=1 Tax=marine sediment metagenome TaxID=412755 RepID=A0A0F9BFX9_9ZZZZ